jgi:hypothetical protein
VGEKMTNTWKGNQVLSTDDMREMFNTLIHNDDEWKTIDITRNSVKVLKKWKQKYEMPMRAKDLKNSINCGAFSVEVIGETLENRRWRLFRENMYQYYDYGNDVMNEPPLEKG